MYWAIFFQYQYGDVAKRDILNAFQTFKDLRPNLDTFGETFFVIRAYHFITLVLVTNYCVSLLQYLMMGAEKSC